MWIKPNDSASVTVVYEHFVPRRDGVYDYSASVSPGELVRDFRISVTIEDHRPLNRVTFTAPVIGDLLNHGWRESSDNDSCQERSRSVMFNMSEVEQYQFFGSHGFTGEFRAIFDLCNDSEVDVVLDVNGGRFLHFYETPAHLKSVPKHVIFLIDVSESMAGPKSQHARDAVGLLLSWLAEDDFFNIITFDDSQVSHFGQEEGLSLNRAFAIGSHMTDGDISIILDDVLEKNMSTSLVGNFTLALDEAFALDRRIWEDNNLPENAYTVLVALTDGRKYIGGGSNSRRRAVTHFHEANKLSRIPLVALGVGIDANKALLQEMAELHHNGLAFNVIEDLEVEPQLSGIREHLDDVVLKNVRLSYVGDAFARSTLTRTRFRTFRKGGAVAVAGALLPSSSFPEFEVEVTGQSTEGLYLENPAPIPLLRRNCSGEITLCSENALEGECVTVETSRANLVSFGFGNRAASANVTGDCSWIVFDGAYYASEVNETLTPGEYTMLPKKVYKAISSLKKLPGEIGQTTEEEQGALENYIGGYLGRVWAFLTIKDVLFHFETRPDRITRGEVTKAAAIAHYYDFLSPFTDFSLDNHDVNVDDGAAAAADDDDDDNDDDDDDDDDDGSSPTFFSYSDLSPVSADGDDDPVIAEQWENLKSCRPPVTCVGGFHLQPFPERLDNCTGSTLTFFTRPSFSGETVTLTSSMHQVYHETNAQRMRSLTVDGDCCWLLFELRYVDHFLKDAHFCPGATHNTLHTCRFFAGRVEKVCGRFRQDLRLTTVGSVKQIEAPVA